MAICIPQIDGLSTDPWEWGVTMDPAFFAIMRFHLKRVRLISYFEKPFLEKRFGVATYFCFILKGKKIRKKNPKCDSS